VLKPIQIGAYVFELFDVDLIVVLTVGGCYQISQLVAGNANSNQLEGFVQLPQVNVAALVVVDLSANQYMKKRFHKSVNQSKSKLLNAGFLYAYINRISFIEILVD